MSRFGGGAGWGWCGRLTRRGWSGAWCREGRCGRGSGGQVAAEPGEDLLPAVDRVFCAVGGADHREERMPGTLVGVELIRLALRLQFLFELRDLVGRGVLVIRAEQAEQRAGQVLGEVLDGADLQRHALGRGAGDERAVAVDGGVEGQAACGQERLPAA